MLKVRPVKETDIEAIRTLHNEYYPEFAFPDFYHLLCGWVIEDDTGIVMAGGVEMCAEALLVSNQAKSNIKLGRALLISQGIVGHTCEQFGIENAYAFVNRDDYAKHLIKHGFVERFERALLMRIPNGKQRTETQ